MRLISSIAEMQAISKNIKKSEKSIGFVPTMGCLHAGHVSLLEKSAHQNQVNILSIFVNPTQFNEASDFENYPKDIDNDCILAKKSKVDYVFLPTKESLYPDQYCFKISENKESEILEGLYRPDHFTGVLTVVFKLLNIIMPDNLYLGEKDYQQYKLIKNMVSALFLPVEVIACQTIRESDGLAMSSRNRRLSKEERQIAPVLYKYLSQEKTAEEAKSRLEEHNFKIDYLIDLNNRRYAAAWLGKTRLIDNIELIGVRS